MNAKKHPTGVTLLLVMLILSIVSSIGVAMTLLIVKQFEQGADVRDALRAQNIADSGVEEILQEIKSARSGSAKQFIAQIKVDYGCENGGKAIHEGVFCTEDEIAQEAEEEAVFKLGENDVTTIDLFDPEFDPASPGNEVTAIEITGVADTATWFEVSWVAWNTNSGQFEFVSTATKEIFSSSEITEGDKKKIVYFKKDGIENSVTPKDYNLYFLNNEGTSGTCSPNIGGDFGVETTSCYCTKTSTTTTPDAITNCREVADLATTPLQYVVRIKALYGSAEEIHVKALSSCLLADTCTGGISEGIPSRISMKVVGEYKDLQQAIRVSVPWRLALAGLFDYVLIAEETLEKTTSVSPGFYSTGTIEAEIGPGGSGAVYTAEATPNTPPDTPFDCQLAGVVPDTYCSGWNVVNDAFFTTQSVRCQEEVHLNASNGATCGFDDDTATIVYSLSTFEIGSEASGSSQFRYWFNYRVRVTSEFNNEALKVYICPNDEDPLSDFSNCYQYIRAFDETSPGSEMYDHAEWVNASKDGWILCSDNAIISNTDNVVFTAIANQPAPRLDWFSITTVPYVGNETCRFSEWDHTIDEYHFEVEDAMTTPPNEVCNQDDPTFVNRCDVRSTWLGNNRVAYPGASGKDLDCDKDRGTCFIESANPSVGDEVGFTLPLKYYDSLPALSDRIAEAEYYVTIRFDTNLGSTTTQQDRFYFDMGPILNRTDASASLYQYGQTYLPSVTFQQFSIIPELRPNITTSKNISTGMVECILPQRMRARSGDAVSFTVTDSNSSGRANAEIDSYTLTHDFPTDASGNNLPLCEYPGGFLPKATILSPAHNSFTNMTDITVRAESQSEATIASVSVEVIDSSSTTTSLVESAGSPSGDEYSFDWNGALADGDYTVVATVTDSFGIEGVNQINVTVDTVDPVYALNYITDTDGAPAGGPYEVSILIGDNQSLSHARIFSPMNDEDQWCNAYGLLTKDCLYEPILPVEPWDKAYWRFYVNDAAGNFVTFDVPAP